MFLTVDIPAAYIMLTWPPDVYNIFICLLLLFIYIFCIDSVYLDCLLVAIKDLNLKLQRPEVKFNIACKCITNILRWIEISFSNSLKPLVVID